MRASVAVPILHRFRVHPRLDDGTAFPHQQAGRSRRTEIIPIQHDRIGAHEQQVALKLGRRPNVPVLDVALDLRQIHRPVDQVRRLILWQWFLERSRVLRRRDLRVKDLIIYFEFAAI